MIQNGPVQDGAWMYKYSFSDSNRVKRFFWIALDNDELRWGSTRDDPQYLKVSFREVLGLSFGADTTTFSRANEAGETPIRYQCFSLIFIGRTLDLCCCEDVAAWCEEVSSTGEASQVAGLGKRDGNSDACSYISEPKMAPIGHGDGHHTHQCQAAAPLVVWALGLLHDAGMVHSQRGKRMRVWCYPCAWPGASHHRCDAASARLALG